MSGDHNMYCSANNPKNEWIELPTLVSVCNAQTDGWEIQVDTGPHWEEWKGTAWMNHMKFRARPRRPKMKKVRMLCWFIEGYKLEWRPEICKIPKDWIRIPAQDIEIEIPEAQ